MVQAVPERCCVRLAEAKPRAQDAVSKRVQGVVNIIILPRCEQGRDLTKIVAFLSALPKEKPWRVTVEEVKSRRSSSQNAYLWGCCYRAFMPHLPGWDADDIHEYMLGEMYGWETVEGFGKKRLKPIRRSSKLSTTEFMDFVAFIQRKGAELGIYIEDPA